MPNGQAPEVGTMFRHPELCLTLQHMADQERAGLARSREAGLERARHAFYRGDIARELAAFVQAEGGLLDYKDLASFKVEIGEAVGVQYSGVEIFGCGAWCQGPMLLQTLKIVAALRIDGLAHNSAAYLHLITETIRLAGRDRECFYGDPNFVEVPLLRLLSDRHARTLAGRIRPDAAQPAWSATGPTPDDHHRKMLDLDTSFISVVDRFGNAFAATPSDGCTTSPVIPGLGFVASPRGNQSWTAPDHPSAIAPGKRPRLTPNPAIAVRDGEFVMPFGTPGHDTQVQVML